MEYDNRVLVCPSCNSSKVRRNGFHRGLAGKKQRYLCTDCNTKTSYPIFLDREVIEENVRLETRSQKLQDLNRIKNKSFREHARINNALSEYNKELIKILKEFPIKRYKPIDTRGSKGVGLIQLSDLHFNELVSMESNKYDFDVASKRLRTFIRKAKKYFKAFGVKKVFVGITGDLLNSDRRLDELLSEATNRASATFIAVEILKQVLDDIRQDFQTSVGCVSGNESRIQKEIGWADVVASDNYDNTIYNILRCVYKEKSDVEFYEMENSLELVVEIARQKVLLIHGHQFKGKIENFIQLTKGRYSSVGVNLDYIILGHIHSARIGDTYGRSSSLVGANSYSEKALNLEGRASQNIYLFFNNGRRDSVKIDLQNYDEKGYDITKDLEAYNSKSHNKDMKGKEILRIVTI